MTRRLFGTNGVRGVANADLGPELAARLGRAVGSWLPARSLVAIGRDARTTGPMLASAATAGLLATGARVVDLGVGPTPAFQYYVKRHKEVQAAMVVTASHNPPEFNGLKLVSGDGTEASQAEEEAVEALFFSEKFRKAPWSDVGTLAHDEGANAAYVDAIAGLIDQRVVARRAPKVVVDTGGGPGGLTTPALLRRLGCKVVTVFEELDGTFAGRKSEPTEENLGRLKETVVREHADLGIAHDGDADRCIFIDERGQYVSGDVSLALLAKARLAEHKKKGAVVCTPVSSSSLIEEVVEAQGGKVVWTAVGSPIVARAMMARKAVYGGEENGGIIFPEHQHCRDAAMTAARMVELVAREGRPLSAVVGELPKFYVAKLKFAVPQEEKPHVLVDLRKWVRAAHPRSKVDETDGLKVFFDDAWVLIRPSGTEPIYRVYAESRRADRAREVAEAFLQKGAELAGKA